MKVGIDIIDVERFTNMDEDRLVRLFDKREIEYFQRRNMAPETIAGIFCAKEAFFKALGTGITPGNIAQICILHDQYGAPYYHLSPKILAENRFLSTAKIALSISNSKTTAVAVCIIMPSSSILSR